MRLSKITFFVLVLLLIASCNRDTGYVEITGETMGSTYSIKYRGDKGLKPKIDSLLTEFSQLFSTYDSNAFLYKFNHNTLTDEDLKHLTERQCKWMTQVFKTSLVIYHKTNKAFNPGLGPLFHFWGFGDNSQNPDVIDSLVIDSLSQYCNYENFSLKGCFPQKPNPNYELNYNAIAAGYATDVVSSLLDSLGFEDYLINITGELKARGYNPNGKIWKISIERPTDNKSMNSGMFELELNNKAMATSGNYRNFFQKEGKKYGHTIDPKTGYPTHNSLLSATVISKLGANCDALATAFMVMGVEDAKRMILSDSTLDGVLIYEENGEMKTWVSWEHR
ncbi:MAG: FAD:protein FMN transferase [Bacteroidetes bacterium]|nr:FAD:protein FMN transferase [Bacteroidota bacterium]